MKTPPETSTLLAVMTLSCVYGGLFAADPPKTTAPRLAPRPIPGMTARPSASSATTQRNAAPHSPVSVVVQEPTVERARIVAIHRRSEASTEKSPNNEVTKTAATAVDGTTTITAITPGHVRIIPREEATKLAAQEAH